MSSNFYGQLSSALCGVWRCDEVLLWKIRDVNDIFRKRVDSTLKFKPSLSAVLMREIFEAWLLVPRFPQVEPELLSLNKGAGVLSLSNIKLHSDA